MGKGGAERHIKSSFTDFVDNQHLSRDLPSGDSHGHWQGWGQDDVEIRLGMDCHEQRKIII